MRRLPIFKFVSGKVDALSASFISSSLFLKATRKSDEVSLRLDTVRASVVIPTRNRCEELRNLLHSALEQTVPVEILVMDDGDSDETRDMIRREFPQVQYHRLGKGRGPAFQRNRGIEKASHNIIFPVDDDSLFISPRTIEQTLREFDHPRVGAVGIPYINVRQDQIVRQCAPGTNEVYAAHAFYGAAHAVRRDVFLKIGGYREHFFYMGEEGEYCLRMLNGGYITCVGTADPIHHLESLNRNTALADYCGRRNDILFAWHNVPTHLLPFHLLISTLNGLRWSFVSDHPLRMLHGLLSGFAGFWKYRRDRAPVPVPIYWLHRKLKKKGPARLEEIEHLLPAILKDIVRKE